jgi:hypothetical protein
VLLQLTRPGGLLAVSTRSHYYERTDYPQLVDELISGRRIERVHSIENATYNNDGEGHYWLYRRLS